MLLQHFRRRCSDWTTGRVFGIDAKATPPTPGRRTPLKFGAATIHWSKKMSLNLISHHVPTLQLRQEFVPCKPKVSGSDLMFDQSVLSSGWWFMHCHLDAHLAQGMAVILSEGADAVSAQCFFVSMCLVLGQVGVPADCTLQNENELEPVFPQNQQICSAFGLRVLGSNSIFF